MNRTELKKKLYEAAKDTANKISSLDAEYGFYAQRKVNHINADSPLKVLIQVGDDLVLISEKVVS